VSHFAPRLRKAVKTNPLFPLNDFPASFVLKLSEHICFHLATRSDGDLEGKDWEKIFADCIGATWSPSNIGLDDITHISSSTAWGAKTVKGKVFTSQEASYRRQTVRLISGRNSPTYSYDEAINPKIHDPNVVGGMILEIWNTRVREVRAKFENLRTVVLIKGSGLLKVVVFEYDTDMYLLSDFSWSWNKNGNLEGIEIASGFHKFTWQPHGSQFTIVEEVPKDALRLQFRKPKQVSKAAVLSEVGFNNSFSQRI
jgi:hypothetical protein